MQRGERGDGSGSRERPSRSVLHAVLHTSALPLQGGVCLPAGAVLSFGRILLRHGPRGTCWHALRRLLLPSGVWLLGVQWLGTAAMLPVEPVLPMRNVGAEFNRRVPGSQPGAMTRLTTFGDYA